MSFETENKEMTCAEFEQSFDSYVDDLLPADLAAVASRHIACCRPCDREVTRWQQTRILLSTAVADFATAVDVSSLRRDVEAALGFADETLVSPRREASVREPEYTRGAADRRAARRPASGRRGGMAAVLRFASAAGVSAMAAAAAVMLMTSSPAKNDSPVVASSNTKPVVAARAASFRPRSASAMFEDTRPAGYTPPPLARPETPHVDGLEAAPGHLVSTWVQPKTNARVIWVQNRGLGAPIRMAGLDR